MAERVEDAVRAGDGGEQVGDAGLGEEIFEAGAGDGGFVAQGMGLHDVEQPGAAAREVEEGARGATGGGGAGGGGTRRARGDAGCDAGHEAGEADFGAPEAGADRDDVQDKSGVFDEGVGDEGDDAGDEGGQSSGGGRCEGAEVGRERFAVHVIFYDINS